MGRRQRRLHDKSVAVGALCEFRGTLAPSTRERLRYGQADVSHLFFLTRFLLIDSLLVKLVHEFDEFLEVPVHLHQLVTLVGFNGLDIENYVALECANYDFLAGKFLVLVG